MNKETYEALKRIIKWVDERDIAIFPQVFSDTKQVREWIDEVAKEYEGESPARKKLMAYAMIGSAANKLGKK